ncbi:ABC transporter substrate-binding protein [Roseomonas sp. OT10]|uniref:ABC transporter substrate-binding protein n=1 Tax=Roseomonas cutis TaxID=2897332 RepID=UPI001E4167F6|nr:ABC transporter substrate-binding protein [Roseomonas sp. OT10]UFN48835.1 ABC transporter substrate-binding protein [Roseomonas sp. OT10]
MARTGMPLESPRGTSRRSGKGRAPLPGRRLVLSLGLALGLAGPAVAPAMAQDLRPVPRNRTLITQGWDLYNQVPSPTNLSPYNGVLLHARNVLHYTVNESLAYTNHITNEIIPWQAEKLETSADFREVTVTLRPGVRWADGQPMTAEDVVFTIDTLKANAPGMVMSGPMRDWVESATATDARTVRIRLTRPNPRWAQDTLATGQTTRFVVLPKHIWAGKDAASFGFLDIAQGWPVGTGPYRVVRSDANGIVFDRLERWWAVEAGLVPALPAPERIVYRPATVEALPQLFAAGEIDMGRALQAGEFEAARARNPRLVTWATKGPVWGVSAACLNRLAFNNQAAPFDKAPVRQAIAALIDRDQIVELAWEGASPAALAPFSSFGGVQAHVRPMEAMIREATASPDRPRAERLLTEAGFRRGPDNRWRQPDGQPWQVTIMARQGAPIAPVVARQLQSFGIDTVFRPMQDAPYFDAINGGGFTAVLFDHCGSLYDPWQTLEHFHSKYAAAPGARIPNLRAMTRYANPELDALLDRMEARAPLPQDAEYQALVRDATRIVLRDMPQVVLTEEMYPVTFNTTYWTGWPSAADPYVAPFAAWDGFALVVHRLRPRS